MLKEKATGWPKGVMISFGPFYRVPLYRKRQIIEQRNYAPIRNEESYFLMDQTGLINLVIGTLSKA